METLKNMIGLLLREYVHLGHILLQHYRKQKYLQNLSNNLLIEQIIPPKSHQPPSSVVLLFLIVISELEGPSMYQIHKYKFFD